MDRGDNLPGAGGAADHRDGPGAAAQRPRAAAADASGRGPSAAAADQVDRSVHRPFRPPSPSLEVSVTVKFIIRVTIKFIIRVELRLSYRVDLLSVGRNQRGRNCFVDVRSRCNTSLVSLPSIETD